MFVTIGLVGLIVLLLIVLASIKKKPEPSQSVVQQFLPTPAPSTASQPEPVRYRSIREQQISEDAMLLASEYQQMQEDRKREEIRESLEVAAAYAAMQQEKRKEELQKLFVK